MRKNKTYTKAFKQECVQYMHNNLSMTFAEAAENLGISASTLQRWYKNAKGTSDGLRPKSKRSRKFPK
jgi:transposase-like protein